MEVTDEALIKSIVVLTNCRQECLAARLAWDLPRPAAPSSGQLQN